ncbi:MAG TPA: flavin reductase family protein [Coriobacteriaceae bacterium]|nr:flavin reductase family protein [Coriobacteriaceae bacterium]
MTQALNELAGNEIATLLIPTTVTLVTACDAAGADKVATIAWVMPISHEPSLVAVAIRPGGQTACALRDSGCFVVNVLGADEDAVRIAMLCGKKQGVDDRVAEAELTLSPGKRVDAVRIDQAISWVECELVESQVYGDHELFIGRTLIAETCGALDENSKLEPMPALLMGQRGRFGHFEEGFSA